MKIHNLKILPIHFYQVENGFKKVELRKNDRKFEEKDTLCLEEWCPFTEEYTGKECNVKVTHILQGDNYGLDKDYVAMSIEIIKNEDLQNCQSCSTPTEIEKMYIDSDSNWFCPECWSELEPIMKSEYKELVVKGEIEQMN